MSAREAPLPLPFQDVLKSQLTQTALTALLQQSGYRVVRLGIEELFTDVKAQPLAQYRKLAFPLRLRCLPDLLVASPDGGPDLLSERPRAILVEVKYRRRFDDRTARALYHQLVRQRRHWPEAYAVVMLSEAFRVDASFHQDYIRVVPPGKSQKLIEEGDARYRWEHLPMLQTVFRRIRASEAGQAMADRVAAAIRGLERL